ncbi:HetP family heterocyst commitment protein [Iningainema tapete]|uniref:HetP family heterocyst commitment protein n=1 Tax=Iningainema tapete BLCC-T55 TaxID=2748662 RepID=A0A8J7BW94_9CYAN|nr:HetP family heterocyst commitment protein [Iningainema tapete]MBD2771422.1 HetP family heterocyst commitment protein [Iningainema tapete BLCC-T55]
MNTRISSTQSSLNRAMTAEQFNEVVKAIADGKYSWACLLILRFAGYNPLHFIPHRTYSRLMKDNNINQMVITSSTNQVKISSKAS